MRRSLIGAVALLALGGCAASDVPQASPSATTRSAALDAAPSDAAGPPQAVAGPSPTPRPEPTRAPDPTVVPEDLSAIDVEYMQAVVDVFAHNEGEIVREAVEHGEITPRMLELMDRAYSEDLRDRSVVSWQEEIAADSSLPNFSNSPGDPIWNVRLVEHGAGDCLGVEVLVDRSPTAASSELQRETIYLVMRPSTHDMAFASWRLDRMLAASAGLIQGRACA